MDNAEELASEEAGWAEMGRHLRELRLGRGWLQETLADAADVSVATIRTIENHPAGRRHTRRTLEKISRALRLPEDYLSDYRRNPRPQESSDKSEATKTAPPPQSALELVAPRLDEILVARLKEIVVPRLENMESEVRALRDVIYNSGGIEIDIKHPSDPE